MKFENLGCDKNGNTSQKQAEIELRESYMACTVSFSNFEVLDVTE